MKHINFEISCYQFNLMDKKQVKSIIRKDISQLFPYINNKFQKNHLVFF